MSLGNWNVEAYWDASANNPKLASGKGSNGKGYIVKTAGTTQLDGVDTWAQGDILIFVLDQWVKVGSVPGGSGGVVSAGAIPEATRTQMQALSFATPPPSLRTNGWDTPGDWGDAFYVKVNSFPTNWPLSGTITTGDGSKYVVTPTHGEYWVEQFGAKALASKFNTTPDSWQNFEDCKYAILLQTDISGFGSVGGITIRVGRGAYYLSKPHIIEGAKWDVVGSGLSDGGTTFRHPWNTEVFIVQSGFGAGTGIGREGSDLNGFPQWVGHLVYPAGSTHIYVATNAGTANVASPPTGTSNGQTSGTATFDYYRERTWVEMIGASGSFSKLSNFVIWGYWTNATDPHGFDEDQTIVDGGYHSGILLRTRATVEDVYSINHPGYGIAVCGDGDPTIRSGGNCNGFALIRPRCYFNGHSGIRIGNSDGNAGYTLGADTGDNGIAGIDECSFLGNRHFAPQSAFDGAKWRGHGKWDGGVNHNGYYWLAKKEEIGSDTAPPNYANEPGTDPNSWIRRDGNGSSSATSDYPAWVNTGTYAATGAFLTNNINSANQVYGMYVEGGTFPAQLGTQDAVYGFAHGSAFEVTRGCQYHGDRKFTQQLAVENNFSFDSGAKLMTAFVGDVSVNAGTAGQNPGNAIWGSSDWEGNQWALKLVGPAVRSWQNFDHVMTDPVHGQTPWAWVGYNTLKTFGRASPASISGSYFWTYGLALGDGNPFGSATGSRIVQMANGLGTGTTSSGSAANGEVRFNNNPSSTSDPIGWRSVGGNWQPFYA